MPREVYPLSSRLALPALLVALVGGSFAIVSEAARLPGFAVMLAGLAVAFWSVTSLYRVMMFQSARQARAEKRAQALQEESDLRQRTFDALIEGLRVMLFVLDDRMHIVAANKAARKGFEFPDPVGQTLVAVTHSPELEELVRLATKSRSRLRDEVVIAHPVEARVRAYAWKNSAVEGQAFLSLLDVTKLRHLETVRKDFVANVSHELRTPMTTIRAMAETLLEGDPGDGDLQDRYLEKIVREVDRLTAMTDDLLTLSKIENQMPMQKPFNFAEVVRSVVAGLESKARDKGIALRCTAPEEAMVMGSGSEMTQVALNLVDNAINYTQEGSVEVRLLTSDGTHTLTVMDTGIGIPEEHQARIFERFYRVDKARSRATGGTGLGLSIVRHIVEAHGGTVKVSSELNKGSVFTVIVPAS
jgi:two-component system phosphate regulon sensor histidine kinase PhoR